MVNSDKILFCLPGTMCDTTLWAQLEACISDDISLVKLAIPERDSFDEMLNELSAQLPDTHFHLVGFSLGGYLATLFASRYPTRIASLTVLSNSPTALPAAELEQRQNTIRYLQHFAYQGAPSARINHLLARQNHNDEAIIQHIQQMERNLGLERLLPQLTATSKREDLSVFVDQSEIPMHFIYGDEDALVDEVWMALRVDKRKQEQKQEQTKRLKVSKLEGVGHMSVLEAPQQVAGLLHEFFAKN